MSLPGRGRAPRAGAGGSPGSRSASPCTNACTRPRGKASVADRPRPSRSTVARVAGDGAPTTRSRSPGVVQARPRASGPSQRSLTTASVPRPEPPRARPRWPAAPTRRRPEGASPPRGPVGSRRPGPSRDQHRRPRRGRRLPTAPATPSVSVHHEVEGQLAARSGPTRAPCSGGVPATHRDSTPSRTSACGRRSRRTAHPSGRNGQVHVGVGRPAPSSKRSRSPSTEDDSDQTRRQPA